MRHGDAEFSLPDSARQLTARGKLQVEKMAKAYADKMDAVELVLTSPLLRACQTTKIFVANAKLDCDIQVVDFLLPDTRIDQIEGQINTFDNKKILMVGHLPLLDYWIDYLIGNYQFKSINIINQEQNYEGI